MEGEHEDTWINIGLAAALILNKLTTRRQLSEQLPERDETKQEERNENDSEEQAHEHQRGKLANLR